MRLAFVLYKYFPFGGLQRDMLRIAKVCLEAGHQVSVYTMAWDGEVPAGCVREKLLAERSWRRK